MDTTQVKTNTKIATMAENDHGERVVKISFPYDLLMLERIRTLPRRAWHPNIKCWSAPIHLDTLNKLLDWGFILDENLLTFIKNVTTKKTDLIEKGVPGLRGKPYPFQNEGVAFIDNNKGRALVADDMGLGKTIEAIAWLQLHPEYRPVIIVVPASLKINWERECHKWMTGIKTVILKGTKPYTFDADIIIINYDILFYWIQELRKCSPQVLITDESHYYKSNTAKRTKAVKMIAKGIPYVIALSGTPIENRPIEIYNALTIIDPMLFPNRWYFLQRYCLPANAPILMNDFTEKKIKDVKIGDVVIGWAADGKNSQRRLIESKVVDTLQKIAPLQKVILSNGDSLTCTPDHKWLTGKTEGNCRNEYSIAKVGNGKIEGWGASKIAFVLKIEKSKYLTHRLYKKGYLIGLCRGDGFCMKHKKIHYDGFKEKNTSFIVEHKIGIGMQDIEPIQRAEEYLQFFDLKYRKYFRQKDKIHLLTINSKDSYEFFTSHPINSDAWWAGFLTGMYDAEGSSNHIHQHGIKNKINCDLLRKGFKRFNIPYAEKGLNGINWKGVIVFRLTGGREAIVNFWKLCSPSLTRKLKSYVLGTGGRFITGDLSTGKGVSYVKKIIPLSGIYKTYTLTTETGNYIAYGYGSKNCNAKYNGFGWDFNGYSNIEELHHLLTSTIMIRRKKIDVLKDLPEKVYSYIPVELSNAKEYLHAEDDFIQWLKETKGSEAVRRTGQVMALAKIEALKQLAVKGKLKQAMEWIYNFLQSGKKLVVFATHHFVIDALIAEFPNISVCIDGRVSMSDRQKAVDSFQNDSNIQLFIGNIEAAGVGITLTAASDAVFLELPWTPGKLVQASDRIHRIGQKFSVTIYFLLSANTIEEKIAKLLDNKLKVVTAVLDGQDVPDESLLSELMKSYV